MKVVITGGAGFVGARLARELLANGGLDGGSISKMVLLDIAAPEERIEDPRVTYVIGDMTERDVLEPALAGADSVFHFASVVSGGAEADLQLGLRVNLDGTRLLMDILAEQPNRPKLVFSSSYAVYSNGADLVTDETTPTPKSSYGVQKLCLEYLIGDYSRRGLIDGRSMRFPTVAIRPGKPNLANSSFASNIIREPLMGRDTVCVVPPESEITLMTPGRLIDAIIKVHNASEEEIGWPKAILLPSVNVSVKQMLQALSEEAGPEYVKRVSFDVKPDVAEMVRNWPQNIRADHAERLGIHANADANEIVREFIAEELPDGV